MSADALRRSTAWSGGLVGLLGGLAAFGIGAGVVFALSDRALAAVTEPLCRKLYALGQENCEFALAASQGHDFVALKLSLLGGAILAAPIVIYTILRLCGPKALRVSPPAIRPYAMASGILALIGAWLAIRWEAPATFAPMLLALTQGEAGQPLPGSAGGYAHYAVSMAWLYALALQIPVIVRLMIKSFRMGRAASAEPQSEGQA